MKLKIYFKKILYQQHRVCKQAMVVQKEKEREEDTQIIAT